MTDDENMLFDGEELKPQEKGIGLRMVQGRGPGKFFSRRTSGTKVGGLGPNFGVAIRKLKHSKIQRPCRGLSPGKGFAPNQKNRNSL